MAAPLLAGAALGLSVAAPFGPVSLICVQQSLNRGCRHGVMAGFGAATGHGIFATAAIAGADIAAAVLTPWSGAIRLLSAAILIGLGVRTIARSRAVAVPSRSVRLRAAYASSLMLSLSNPMTIVPYLALATVAAGERAGCAALSPWSIPGIMLAAAAWYAGLSFVTSVLRRGITRRTAWLLNLTAGVWLIALGALVGRDVLRVLGVAGP